MKTHRCIAFVALSLLILVPVKAQSNETFDFKISPSQPAVLSFGEKVSIRFAYTTRAKPGVRIFARPMSGGRLAPNYRAHGSPLHPTGRGEVSGFFTIGGQDVLVDGIRVQMVSESRRVLHSQVVPVRIRFTENPLAVRPAPSSGQESSAKVLERTILPDGQVEIRYSDGRIKRIDAGGYTIIHPDGRRNRVSFYSVQPDTPPALPGDAQVVSWLEEMNERLLLAIRRLVGMEESVVNYYLQKEAETAEGLYGKIQFRLAYIGRLTSE